MLASLTGACHSSWEEMSSPPSKPKVPQAEPVPTGHTECLCSKFCKAAGLQAHQRLGSRRPVSKNRGPNPNAVRSLFDGNFEIMRHTHRKNFHADRRQVSVRNMLEQFPHSP